MDFSPALFWLQNHVLSVAAVLITLLLLYHYLSERGTGIQLSKRYRNSLYEVQSKIFLNATQYLISGNRDLAIREFLNAVDLNKETLETYFALGGLFRSNGEIEKAISIHRSLIARENLSETFRLKALKELALDFDKGGLIDKALETYKDVLRINRDQYEVIQAMCRIYEDIGEWDEAFHYRIMLSKVGQQNQSETISHILVQKAKEYFQQGKIKECIEELDDAFRFAPSVSAKILQFKLHLYQGDLENSKALLIEILKQHPEYSSFLFVTLDDGLLPPDPEKNKEYEKRADHLKSQFLKMEDDDLMISPSVVLSKVRLFKSQKQVQKAYDLLRDWINSTERPAEVMKVEFMKLLIQLEKKDEALIYAVELVDSLNQGLTRHYCSACGYNTDEIFWRCPQCYQWETIQFRWKV